MAVQLNVGSVRATITSINGVSTLTESAAAMEALQAAGDALASQIKKNLSLRDHSLQDLAEADHPYARRHGSIRLHTGGGSQLIAVSTSVVHMRSRRLVNSLKTRIVQRQGARYEIQLDESLAPHARYIVSGTRVMLPRDPLWHTATDKRMKAVMMRNITRRLGKELRSKTAVRFNLGMGSRPSTPTGI